MPHGCHGIITQYPGGCLFNHVSLSGLLQLSPLPPVPRLPRLAPSRNAYALHSHDAFALLLRSCLFTSAHHREKQKPEKLVDRVGGKQKVVNGATAEAGKEAGSLGQQGQKVMEASMV